MPSILLIEDPGRLEGFIRHSALPNPLATGRGSGARSRRQPLVYAMARGGIEPPTPRFSVVPGACRHLRLLGLFPAISTFPRFLASPDSRLSAGLVLPRSCPGTEDQ
jgi:hypothetical protein